MFKISQDGRPYTVLNSGKLHTQYMLKNVMLTRNKNVRRSMNLCRTKTATQCTIPNATPAICTNHQKIVMVKNIVR